MYIKSAVTGISLYGTVKPIVDVDDPPLSRLLSVSMIEAQSLDLLSDQLLYSTTPAALQHFPTKLAAAAPLPSTQTLTINTGLTGLTPQLTPALAAPAPTLKSLPTTSRRFLGPGLTRMHPYYYVQYVPLDLKQNLVRFTFYYSLHYMYAFIFLYRSIHSV